MRLTAFREEVSLFRFQFPSELSGEPAEQEEASGVAGAGDRHALDFADPGKGAGMVEELGEREARSDKACPIQIAKNRADFRERPDLSNQAELLGRGLPFSAVVDQAVHPPPELLVERFPEVFLPPEIERKVGIEVGEHDVGKRRDHVAIESESDLLGANLPLAFAGEVAVSTDPGPGFRTAQPGLAKIRSARQAYWLAILEIRSVLRATSLWHSPCRSPD